MMGLSRPWNANSAYWEALTTSRAGVPVIAGLLGLLNSFRILRVREAALSESAVGTVLGDIT